ncbi:cell adhesion molecule Dscam2-like [Ornithodoros turicata]|uniref:cell adhesion molecule Dscam2-like n=1 Tax=Ornithodoros turicata TaxID=34597 RepID=UPI0031399F80
MEQKRFDTPCKDTLHYDLQYSSLTSNNLGPKQKEWVPIENAPQGNLKITSATKKDEQGYKCTARNGVGRDIFKTIVVTVTLHIVIHTTLFSAAPKILPFVIPKRLLVGERFGVTCATASGGKPFQFVWLKDGQTLHPSKSVNIVDSSEYSTLSIQNLVLENSGNYTCVVSNAAGTESYSDSLDIKAPPVWVREPEDTSVTAGQSTELQCESKGHPTPTVTWKRIDGTTVTTLSGRTIKIASASKAHQATFSCLVTNGVGNDLHKTVRLSVKSAPKIIPFTFPKNLLVGEHFSVACAIASGEKPFRFVWLKDGTTLRPGKDVQIAGVSEYSTTLAIQNLALENSGNYTCVVSNAAGTMSYSEALEIKAPPAWIQEPKDTTVTAGQSVELRCEGKGFPRPTVTWRRTDGEQVVTLNGTTIKIASVNKAHQATYRCLLTNGIGHDLQKTSHRSSNRL